MVYYLVSWTAFPRYWTISWEDSSNLKVWRLGYTTVLTWVVPSTLSLTTTGSVDLKSFVIGISSMIIGWLSLSLIITTFLTSLSLVKYSTSYLVPFDIIYLVMLVTDPLSSRPLLGLLTISTNKGLAYSLPTGRIVVTGSFGLTIGTSSVMTWTLICLTSLVWMFKRYSCCFTPSGVLVTKV